MKKKDVVMSPCEMIKEMRSKGISLPNIAEMVGISHSYAWKLMNEKRKGLAWDKMESLKKAYNSTK